MSDPLSLPSDLGVYMGRTDLDYDRALLLLQLAHDRMEVIVSPVPIAAMGIELSIASRAYNNVTSAHQVGIGSANVSYGTQNSAVGIGGLYMSKSERADLRRFAGRTGAFSIDVLPGTP